MTRRVSESRHRHGTVLLVVVFATALMAVLVSGMLQINIEDVQITRNQISAAEALAVAEAGLNDAMAELKADSNWQAGFSQKSFPGGGDYTVVVENSQITSTGRSADGYTSTVIAKVHVSGDEPPHRVTIACLRVNE